MNLLILGKFEDTLNVTLINTSLNLAYRGSDRVSPPASNADEFDPHHEFNEAVRWFREESFRRRTEVVHDLEKARRVVWVYKQYAEADYEIIEVTIRREPPVVGTELLGFDI